MPDVKGWIKNVQQFQKAVGDFVDRTDGRFDQKIRKIALMVLQGVIEKNPVDTGLSQNNWQLDVGTVNEDIIPAGQNAGGVIERGISGLGKLRNHGIGEVIFIFNNVEYTIFLEFGTDKMPPFAMVRDTLRDVAVSLA
jgi:hypothetical protein